MDSKAAYRNSMIDILKGIGMVLVIITHYNWSNSEKLNYLFPFWVSPAVPVFIIISGYVYSMSYERNGMQTLADCYRYRFVANKLIRYTIPFLMAYFVEVMFYINSGDFTLYDMLVRFIAGGTGPGSYYYPVMIQFIFVFPFIYGIVKKYDFIGVVICFFLNGMYEVVQHSYDMSPESYRLLVFRYLFLMSAGCYLYIGKKKPKLSVGIVSMLLGACWLAAYCYRGYRPTFITHWCKTCLLAALWTVPIVWVLLKNPRLSRLKCPPLEEMGKASYNIFLTQMIFFAYGADAVYKAFPNRAAQLAVFIFGSTLVGYVFYMIESKITNGLSKICKKHDYWSAPIHRAFEKIETAMTK
jgi:peptidoglycan/LPS O-acetylase OafA/YrhL